MIGEPIAEDDLVVSDPHSNENQIGLTSRNAGKWFSQVHHHPRELIERWVKVLSGFFKEAIGVSAFTQASLDN